ncbi:FMN-binding negative transcriptional regulator [Pseudoxanthomonas dokdonensis]|uniref:Transcriptional regulator n=1 Tax=Pseudoxanthomonas dokdonensis TaxID=344882 RepID=A0A0R0CW51_9GAMM|nr:FMN-binding negative transcriptional regulator [Pseudoxanthomonas dokdonensis]KRG70618.1 hypothetical protein ABB29_06055 [Pseudoxanthomonas dokdonensis]
MYRPRAFVETELEQLDALLARDAFITLLTCRDNLPTVSHVPVLYQRDGEHIVLTGHWARPNPQAGHAGQALAIVHGPHAYLSPSWYPDKDSAARVPTWNYAVAHLHGDLQTTDDHEQLADIVGRLSRHYEATVGSDWLFDAGRGQNARQLGGIIGFRLHVQQVEMKFKLSQNHPPANIEAAASQLSRQAHPDGPLLASMMRARLPTG